ncbi:hypothetical protein ACET3Z_005693 [Daucus carota]
MSRRDVTDTVGTVGEDDDEGELELAAIERIEAQQNTTERVSKLGALERHAFIDRLLKKIEEDNHRLLLKQRQRIDRVGLEIPTVEVRYKNVCIEAECDVVQGEPLPTLWNTLKRITFGITRFQGHTTHTTKIKILQDVSGIIRPSRMTLLLGPPGCGKTTLLLALSGTIDKNLEVSGEISYNGYKLNEFIPHKTAAYVSQYDQHISEMTVRETLDFAARCLGIGSRAETMAEVVRREKQVGIIPDPDIDTYMKETAINGLKRTLQTDYILKILGLEICADTIVGNAMRRGISGGQKKRLTTGEMIIGPSKVLFMDEISNGLDSSSTFQIVKCLQQLTHITESTTLISLLQPAPETFDLFDDIILMSEGQTVYHGPRDNVIQFFENCGFRCPARKGVADFLQEVISEKDQAQYWHPNNQPIYVSVKEFARKFKESSLGQKSHEDLSQNIEKDVIRDAALTFHTNSTRKWEIFQACMAREWVLMKRNSFVHAFKSAQLVVSALITMTVFLRTQTSISIVDANYFLASLFYSLIRFNSNAIPELSMTVSRLSIFYKQRDFNFYPAWAYSIPAVILKIPFSFLDAFLWTGLTYYVIGYSPEPERFFHQLLLLAFVNQVSTSLFRLIASIFTDQSVATFCGLFTVLVMFLFCGFIIPQPSLPSWLKWGFWLSPFTYAEIGISVNEFLSPRWQKDLSLNATIGHQFLKNHGFDYRGSFYWISIGALLGFWIILNIGFTCALKFSKAPRRSQTVISLKRLSKLQAKENTLEASQEIELPNVATSYAPADIKQMGMVLPFKPMTITFENVQYFVDTPKKMREKGYQQKTIQLLHDITGSFQPGVLTALMGVTGAGKTTLLDVLSGRKNSGIIEGDIRIGGYPKVQDTYARISGYCEQTDIHSPQITVNESLTYSAWLRLPPHIDDSTKAEFVVEVLQMIELEDIKDALVGVPGVSGLTNEQRKRLTIAVELVSNPSIIFMDEPTSGLDARAAAIVMRAVKNIANTNRTVVCTIHQPSIDIFEAFDELILMKRGGQIIYSGELGQHSSKLIEYFENINGLPKIQENYNPATWMLEITSSSSEEQLGLNFVQTYENSHLCRQTKQRIKELSSPAQGSTELQFSTRFSQTQWEQLKACLWKQNLSYWRSPKYNLVRLAFITMASVILAAILWQKGKDINGEQDLLNILGSMFLFLQFLGTYNCTSVLSIIATERNVVYRERFAGMYSAWIYSFAQVIIEIPYVFLQVGIFVIITYPAVGFYWSVYKVLWYFFTMFCTMLYYTYLGMLLVSTSGSLQVAFVMSSFSNTIMSLFSGFLIPEPKIPKWWNWCYWICPGSWSLRGLLTSQYGDVDREIVAFGEKEAINTFLGSYFGYHSADTGVVALVLIAFPILFASIFAYSMAKLNFQRR